MSLKIKSQDLHEAKIALPYVLWESGDFPKFDRFVLKQDGRDYFVVQEHSHADAMGNVSYDHVAVLNGTTAEAIASLAIMNQFMLNAVRPRTAEPEEPPRKAMAPRRARKAKPKS